MTKNESHYKNSENGINAENTKKQEGECLK
jgi:hypothetical protein